MQLTANKAVAAMTFQFVRAICFLIGLMVVVGAVRFAIDKRADSYIESIPQQGVSAREIQKQLTCLSRNIYWEAASEPFEGKVAVAQVTVNRMESGKFPDSVCGVVHQKTSNLNRVVCQFSWLCESAHKVKPIHEQAYRESEDVAKMVMLEGFRLKGLEKALYYHADYVNPKWNKDKVSKIGRHIFYKDKE